jgi:hypothetical protein
MEAPRIQRPHSFFHQFWPTLLLTKLQDLCFLWQVLHHKQFSDPLWLYHVTPFFSFWRLISFISCLKSKPRTCPRLPYASKEYFQPNPHNCMHISMGPDGNVWVRTSITWMSQGSNGCPKAQS